jgi:putative ABC transport system permease protein
MNLFSITFKNMRSRFLRTALTILGVGGSIAAFVAFLGLTNNLADTLKNTYKKRGTDLIVVEKGMADILTSTIDQEYAQKIREIPGVDRVGAIAVDFQTFKLKQYVLVYGWELGSYLFDEIKITGDKLKNESEVLVGIAASKKLNKKIGDKIKIKGSDFTVTGLFQSQTVLEDGGVIIALPKLQALRKMPGKITMLNIGVRSSNAKGRKYKEFKEEVAEAQKLIQAVVPEIDVKNVDEFVEENTAISIALNFTWAISIVAFIIAVMGITNTMMTSILERSQEIGILIAMGWRKHRIMALIILESLILGLLGGVFGIFLGYGLMKLFTFTPQLGDVIQIFYDTELMLKVIGGSIVLGLVAGLYPAIRAISLNPLEVLRNE